MLSNLSWFLPHFFTKEPIPEITHPDLLVSIQTVQRCSSLEVAMKKALDMLAAKYQSGRFQTYLLFPKAYETDPNILWQRSGFMHCTQQNYLFRVLLTQSGWLKDDQIKLGYSLVWYISPHQFLKVVLPNGKQVAIDPWNYKLGAQFGKYATGFSFKTL